MTPIQITLKESKGYSRHQEPLRFGVPLPQGALPEGKGITLTDTATAQPIPSDCSVTATWPDRSARWVLIQTQVDLSAHSEKILTLLPRREEPSPPTVSFTVETDGWVIETPDWIHKIAKASFRIDSTSKANPGQPAWTTTLNLEDANSASLEAMVEEVAASRAEANSCLDTILTGHWRSRDGQTFARFEIALAVHSKGSLVDADIRIHNPNRAMHPGGLWDLGDPGSAFFSSLSLNIAGTSRTQARLVADQAPSNWQASQNEPLSIYQDSSGGEQWNSRNHQDKDGKVTTRFKGYKVQWGASTDQGSRVQPILEVTCGENVCGATLHKFWQNFPSGLQATDHGMQIDLFPATSGQTFELQGGERKTHRVTLQFGQPAEALHWACHPLTPVVEAVEYEVAQALPWFTAAESSSSDLDNLIQAGITGPGNFFDKRETIDEYGWRNFGDLFADHETLYQAENEPSFISHYNNQYDAIYGFARQFARTGDNRWFELMDDLARHVTDIDIYHTDQDRVEYNNGLFWHTDHYLDAHTATHRTFTKHNDTSSTPGQTGGGPAAEHCYTTGLALHYFLTGNLSSRQAVTELAAWMIASHDGGKGLFSKLWYIKQKELGRLKEHFRNGSSSPYRYPFTRGTGNYITALIDAFEVSEDHYYLHKAENVIKNTIHPADDITKRTLLSVEECWSYLVLLTALTRYLELKDRYQQSDAAYAYTKAACMHYLDWMKENERPFLSDPSALEFPNETWTAQDIRKAMLMFWAANETEGEERQAYLEKAQEWFQYSTGELQKTKTRTFTRILVILLQNYGLHQFKKPVNQPRSIQQTATGHSKAPASSMTAIVGAIAKTALLGLLEFRPSRERSWLAARLSRK